MSEFNIAIKKILKASEILDSLGFGWLACKIIICAEDAVKNSKKKKKLKRRKKDVNDSISIVENQRIISETRKPQEKVNSFGPEAPYSYKSILSKEDLNPDVFFFAKNKDYTPQDQAPSVGLTDNVMNQNGFGMVDIGGGFLRDRV